jgi:predicted nucleic acid-binding protein
VEEEGSGTAAALWDGCDAAVSSRLAYPEVCAALAAAGRNHDLDTKALLTAARDWDEFWTGVRPIELTQTIERRAGQLASRRALGCADAVHLASALAVDSDDLIVAVWDGRLHGAAKAEGLTVAPAGL